MKKKILAGILVLVMAGSMLVGCKEGAGTSDTADMSSFTSTDIEGNEATQDIFKDYDVTMVNVWASWCQYCVEEMPYIEKLYESLDSNVNIVGVCMDASSEKETVLQEIADTGITYTTIVDNDEIRSIMDPFLISYPTTFFVDSEGHMITAVDPMLGAPGKDEQSVIDAYSENIQKALDSIQ